MDRLDPRSWPIRWRLTALNVAVLALALTLLGGAVLGQLDSALVQITADHLRDRARLAIAGPPGDQRGGPPGDQRGEPRGDSRLGEPKPGEPKPGEPRPGLPKPGEPRGEPKPGEPSSAGLARGAPGIVRRLSGPDSGALVYDSAGTLLAATEVPEGVEAWPVPTDDQVVRSLAGEEVMAVVAQDTRRTLVLLLPIPAPEGGRAGVLALAGSLDLTESVETRVRGMLLTGAILALTVAGILSLWATRDALRPLEQVIAAARRIGAGKLDERLRLARRDEIGALSEAFDSMLDRLAAALLAQRRFVADAAHELRTPLTALGGMIEMLEMGAHRGDPVRIRRILDTMSREVQRLSRLVADLLTLSRLDADQPLRPTPVDLESVLTEVVQQTRLLTSGQEIELQVEARPTVWGDADRLKQVLLNLANNALAHTPSGGRVTFRLDRAGTQARLVVADSGSGIAPELLPRVMDRFTRGDDSRARTTGGAGLGLAIVRSIVEAHHGTIALTSEVGQGTSVTVEIPVWSGRPVESSREAVAHGSGSVPLPRSD